MGHRSRLIVGFFFATLLLGCPTTTTPITEDPDAGPVDFVGRACNVDAECGNLRCDKVRHQCICLTDQSCASADISAPLKYCNNYTGLCVTEIIGCKIDGDCQSSEYCDAATRACRPLKSFCETCGSNTECGGQADNCITDAKLNQKYCGKACQVNADCPRGATCENKEGSKQCWPTTSPVLGQEPSCKNFQGCIPNSLRSCNTTAECMDSSQRCDPTLGKCVAISQVCPFGTTCDPRNKICVADCAVDADCGDPKLRCTNKICEPVGECATDAQCPSNKVCTFPPGATVGQCVPFCTGDTDCPIGQACQKVNDKYRCDLGCTTSSNCPLNQRCNTTTKLCEGPVVAGKKICQASASCSSCEVCDFSKSECTSAKAVFPYCQLCGSPADCTGGACVTLDKASGGTSNYCVRFCSVGQECPNGFVCLGLSTGQNACVPSNRQCDGKCP